MPDGDFGYAANISDLALGESAILLMVHEI